MQGTLSFHPVDLTFFDDLIQPLLAGEKVNPGRYLQAGQRVRQAACTTARYTRALESHLQQLVPPAAPAAGGLWNKVRTRLERLDFRPDPVAVLVAQHVDVDLHLHGRPFFITEGSAERVVTIVDEYLNAPNDDAVSSLVLEQLVRLDPQLARCVQPDEQGAPTTPNASYRTELLGNLKQVFDLARAARDGAQWNLPGGTRAPAGAVLVDELPWRAISLHGRAAPYWTARDVDGLATVCQAAGVEVPDFLTPAWRLFGDACDTFPGLRDSLKLELRKERDLGAFVSPRDVPRLLAFLNETGSRIIQVATRHGEGPACTNLLRMIKECALHAELHGKGYAEAVGVQAL